MSSQSGLSLIATVLALLLFSLFIAVAVSLVTTGASIGLQEEQGVQAFYIAEGGMEYILANSSVPNYSTQGIKIPLGSGNFVVSTPTYVKTSAVAIGNTTINVDSTTGFASPPGKIVIDSEVITYTGTTANTFSMPLPGAKEAHAIGNAVYPATSVSVDPGVGGLTITVASTTGFVIPGVIKIDNEYIYCTGTNATQFTNCTRAYKGTTAAAHPVGSNVFQYIVRSTGTITSNPLANPTQRVAEKTVVGVSAKQGSFTKRTTGVGTQSVTGIGFKPNAVIFFWTRQTVPPPSPEFGAGTTSINEGVGFASGPANQCVVSTTANQWKKSDAGRRYSQSNAIIFLSGGGLPGLVLVAQAGLNSLDADGFTLNWTTNNDANAYLIHYIALGGDITNAVANTFSLTTVGGNQAVAGVGFQPDVVMFLWFQSGAATYNTNLSRAQLGIGFAQSAASQAAIVVAGGDNIGSNADKRWQQRTDSSILLLSEVNPPVQYAVASLVSMDANGFTLTKSTAPAAATPIFYLALKGGQHKVSAFNQAVAVGPQTTTGVGFRPEQVMLASDNWNVITNNVVGSGGAGGASGAFSIGAAKSAASYGGIWFQDRSDRDDTADQMNMYTSTATVLTLATAPSTLKGQANFTTFVNNGFTLNWTSTDGTARQILYWAIGPNPAASNISRREVYP